MKPIEIVCHKGANEIAPENTYAAAQYCIDWGADYVEIDVRTSQDGVCYLLHDATLERTTNGRGYLHMLPAAEIDQLEAGSWFHPRYQTERVPRLEPFLRWIKGKAKIFFDVKAADPQQLIDLVYATGFERDCFFWSGSDAWARHLRALDPTLALKLNVASVADVQRVHEEFQADIVEVGLEHMSDALLAACRDRGIKVMLYHQQKNPAAFRSVLRWGVDLINLNHADLFIETRNRYLAEAEGDAATRV